MRTFRDLGNNQYSRKGQVLCVPNRAGEKYGGVEVVGDEVIVARNILRISLTL